MPPQHRRIKVMTRTRRSLVGTIVAAGVLFATAVAAVAETCTLKLKRRETKLPLDPASYMFWSVRPQYFYVQMTADENGRWRPANPGNDSQAEAFKRIVEEGAQVPVRESVPRRGQVRVARIRLRPGRGAGRQGQEAGRQDKPRRKPDGRVTLSRGRAGGETGATQPPNKPRRSRRPSRHCRSRILPTTGSISISITTAT